MELTDIFHGTTNEKSREKDTRDLDVNLGKSAVSVCDVFDNEVEGKLT